MDEITLLYPPIEPFWADLIPVSPIHSIYAEVSGNPDGTPVVFLHGGPGGGSSPSARRFFDPDRYKIVLFDQRGCGSSTPNGELRANTSADLVSDMEVLRERLKIDRWLVFGGSWGSTLALAYAQAHPERVRGLILWGIFLGTQSEIDWTYQTGVADMLPAQWASFRDFIPSSEHSDLAKAYMARLADPDRTIREATQAALSAWEMAVLKITPGPVLAVAELDEPNATEFVLPPEDTTGRIEMHYMTNRCFLEPGQLRSEVERIRNIPSVILSGADDLMCPPSIAASLARRWPQAQFHVVPGAGHSSMSLPMLDRLIEATDAMVDLP